MCPTQFRHLWLSDLQRIVLNLENNCTIYTKAGGLTQQTYGSDKQYSTVGKGVIVIFVAHRLLGHEVSRCIHVCKYQVQDVHRGFKVVANETHVHEFSFIYYYCTCPYKKLKGTFVHPGTRLRLTCLSLWCIHALHGWSLGWFTSYLWVGRC